jgi:hypothetical protein
MDDYTDELSPYCVHFPSASPSDLWDTPLKILILASLAGLIVASLHAQTFNPLLRLTQAHGISALLLRPSILIVVTGPQPHDCARGRWGSAHR